MRSKQAPISIIKRGQALVRQRKTFLLYALIGVSGIVLDILVFASLVRFFQVDPVVATIISTSLGIINNFLWNARFNFKTDDHLWLRFASFYAIGTAGIIASSLILLLFANIFWFDATVVKLISVPPIVLAQYFLNKRFSFGYIRISWPAAWQFIKRHRYLLLVNILFLCLSLLLVRYMPFDSSAQGAPDETGHYYKNVEFILNNHRLPISGQDDLDYLSLCRNNEFGAVPCIYSYQVYPAFNYVVSAVSAKIFIKLGISDQARAARMASVMWGLLAINMFYLIARFWLSRHRAVVLMAIVAGIPQLIFVASYINQDIHSLALSALLIYSSLRYLLYKKKGSRWLFYLSFGLLFSAKYNYFITALIPLGLLIYNLQINRQFKVFAKELAWLGGAALVLSGFWFIRNYVLYHDALGQEYVLSVMERYHAQGEAWPANEFKSYAELILRGFFDVIFNSFFMTLGYMNIRLDESFYTLLKIGLIGGLLTLWRYTNRTGRWVIVGILGFIVVAIAQAIMNSIRYDFQPQGRYLFVVLPVVVAGVAFSLSRFASQRSELVKTILLVAFAFILLLDIQSILTVIGQFREHGLGDPS